MSFLFKTLRSIIFVILFLLIAIGSLFAILQSKWAKEEIKKHIVSTLSEAGIQSHLSHLNGRLPFSWTVDEAQIHLQTGEELKLQEITLRLAILPLFKGKIDINYVSIEKGEYLFSSQRDPSLPLSLEEIKKQLRDSLKNTKLPCSLNLKYVAINECLFINQQTQEQFSLGATGNANIKKDKTNFSIKLHLFSPASHQTYLEAALNGNKQQNKIEGTFYIQLDSIPSFSPIQGEISSSISAAGPWSTWEAILYDLPVSTEPLIIQAEGICSKTKVMHIPSLNTDWEFTTSFIVDSSEHIEIKKLKLKNPSLQLYAKGSLKAQIQKSQLAMTFSFSDLSPYFSVPTSGTLEGKALYKAGEFKVLFEAKNLEIDTFKGNTVLGKIQGDLKGSQITAQTELSSEDAPLPFQNKASVAICKENIAIRNLEILMGNDTLKGDLSYDLTNHLYTGALSISIQELSRFESLFKTQRFYGNAQAELNFHSEEGIQTTALSLLGHHMRYENILLDDLSLRCHFKELFTKPQGEFHLLAEKVYSEGIYLEKILIDTQSEAYSFWPFSIELQGRIETPFTCKAQGNWVKNAESMKIELSTCEGMLLDIPLNLEHPTLFSWENNSLELTPLDLEIGMGHLHSSFALNPQQTRASLEINHLPLEILRCLHPRFELHGFLSAKGSLLGVAENLQGNLNAVLEEVSITHFGKEEPFHSKGSVQIHCDNNRMQIHTDLKATDAQFLDFTASLPIDYTPYPFAVSLNQTATTSAELTAEGKLEDLFDFINLGTNHFSGLISCRLFLSQTLKNPSLLGNLELQNGTYDNYFTGIALKSINAQFEAESTRIKLTELTAKDDQSGTVSGSGEIELKPQENFPYHFDAEMSNLHALGFDMIDCHLSGPLYLKGNTQEMLAQGNLLIDKAKIQVTERLPYEVASIPFTYVHKPQHLDSMKSSNGSKFAFHLDLELTAHDHVLVEGKGLNAELEGDIHLHGTNTNIAANGNLNLVKGEYIFSGKVFKLTEANVLFNDKPSRSAYLSVSGTLSMPDITITAMMRGPLTSPQLTFQSNPHKPTSSILALILFNKDISEINHMEAVQLASTVISLSGGAGPDVLESIRKTIGVDRLNISSKPGTDEIAVQVGKYLTHGITITLSQSATSSQVIVEVELPKGFIFQAETQEQEEGKFSLKWRKNY